MAYKIGIDFGTTNTVISYIKDGEPQIFKNNDTPTYFIPSLISKDKTLIGIEAMNVEYVKAMKMFLPLDEDERKKHNWNGDSTVEEYIKKFFEILLKKEHPNSFENRIGEIEKIVLCVPQVWSNEITHVGRKKLSQIFEDLGYEVSKTVSEPVAAAAYFVNWHRRAFNDDFLGKLLVSDMGGGTFDVTLCEVNDTGEIKSVKNVGNGTTLTGKGFAGVYFDETLIKSTYSRLNKELNEQVLAEVYLELQDHKNVHQTSVLRNFENAEQQPSQIEKANSPIYRLRSNNTFTYQDVVASFEKIRQEIRTVLKKVDIPSDSIDAHFLTGGFNQFYLCRKEIGDFFGLQNRRGTVFDARSDASIAGKSISFGAALIANGIINIDERFTHSFGFISYKRIYNPDSSGLYQKEYNCIIEGGNILDSYSDYSFSKTNFSIPNPKNFKYECFVDFNSDRLHRYEFTFSNFKVPNPEKPNNKWTVGLKIDKNKIVHVAFKDTSGKITEYQIDEILEHANKLISE